LEKKRGHPGLFQANFRFPVKNRLKINLHVPFSFPSYYWADWGMAGGVGLLELASGVGISRVVRGARVTAGAARAGTTTAAASEGSATASRLPDMIIRDPYNPDRILRIRDWGNGYCEVWVVVP
jgi:hypothetical protein